MPTLDPDTDLDDEGTEPVLTVRLVVGLMLVAVFVALVLVREQAGLL